MVSREKILDDLARVAGGAATLLGEAGKQANESFRNRIDQFAQIIGVVAREAHLASIAHCARLLFQPSNDLGAESTLSSQPAIQELRDRVIAGNSIKGRVRIDYVTKISNCEKS